MSRSEQPPHAPAPYRLLGEIPYGGPDNLPVLRGRTIAADERATVLAACSVMIRTAEHAARIPAGARLTVIRGQTPIDPFAFETGIREYYDRNAWISPLDVMLYVCRAVDRLMVEIGARTGDRLGGYPTDRERMGAVTSAVASEVKQAMQMGR